MIIKTLVENTTIADAFEAEHGLSLYIETKKHKLLFDLGASELFAENAEKMGVDLSAVDAVFISHGHADHGGGLETFLKVNTKAKIYLNAKAFEKHYSNRPSGIANIGLNSALLPNERFVFVGNTFKIDEELELFSNVTGSRLNPSGNETLLMEKDAVLVPDDFAHEQNLIIKENGETLLIAGCAHRGIVNIVEHYNAMKNSYPSHVIGGFHLYNRSKKKSENPEVIEQIGAFLLTTGSNYHTCHCTGLESYNHLKEIMGEKIDYLATGSQLNI